MEEPSELNGTIGSVVVGENRGESGAMPAMPAGSRPLGQIGGWLVVLIMSLWLNALGGIGSALEINSWITSLEHSVPVISSLGLLLSSVLYCGVTVLSVYCARVLDRKKPNAVPTAKRCLLGMLILAWVAAFSFEYLVLVPMNAAPLMAGQVVPQMAAGMTFWFVIWYSYLVRSKRVRQVYYRDFVPAFDEEEGYEQLERATALERKGRLEEALAVYQSIVAKYAETAAADDARKSIENLRSGDQAYRSI